MRLRLSIAFALATLFSVLAPGPVLGQQAEEDVVYLTNGAVVRGTIVEQRPGESISIRTKDGSVFVYPMTEIVRMTKEPVFGASGGRPVGEDYKEPGTATLLSVVCPGCGQLWTGETKRGAVLLGVGIGAPAVGAAITAASCDLGCSTAPILLGVAAAFGAWIYGITDAGDSARRMNARRGVHASASALALRPSLAVSPSQLSIAVRLQAGSGFLR